jgi:membrane protease YdiL (CAAX protease family)
MWIAIIVLELLYIIIARTITLTMESMSFEEEALLTLNRIVISLIVFYLFRQLLLTKKPNYHSLKSPWWIISMLLFLSIPPLANYMDHTTQSFKLFYAFTALFVAIHEEIVYRGVIQELLMRHLSPIKAIVVTSLIFTIYHIGAIDWYINLYIQIFLAGIILGVIYYQTQSLALVIALHTLYDALVTVTPIGDTLRPIITYSEGTNIMLLALFSVWIWFRRVP